MIRLFLIIFAQIAVAATDFRGAQFISISKKSELIQIKTEFQTVFVQPDIEWDELVVSWNFSTKGDQGVEALLLYPTVVDVIETNRIATWRLGTNRFSATRETRVSTPGFPGGQMDTDTFKLTSPTYAPIAVFFHLLDGANLEQFKFLGFAFRNSKEKPSPLDPNRRAWGKTLEVRPRSQLDYEEGAKIWCSPTSTSMILDYWSQKLHRPELSLDVPEVARGVYDTVYRGTGNWPFNTAFAGSFPGMRGYVTRLTDVSEIEDWIKEGIPLVASVSYNRLKGLNKSGSGHLIVCVGFTESGDIIVNDPGTNLGNVRRTFPRDLFREAWADSGNTVYIIYPETAAIPPARHGHWESR